MATIVIRTAEARHAFEMAPAHSTQTLSAFLAARGFPLNTRCGGRGLCRGCEVELHRGIVMVDGARVDAPATIQSCQVRASAPIELEIPVRSSRGQDPQVGETFRVNVPIARLPLFAPRPGICDTAFAIDLGTTTVVVLLVDLVTGQVLSRAGGFNEQIRFGDNVLTRIDAGRDPSVVREMRAAIVRDTISPLLDRACERANRGASRLAGGTVAGNVTMLHLLTGEDPTPLGVAPFTPRFLESRKVTCGELNLRSSDGLLSPDTPVQLLPGIAAYVGADIVAGIHATGMVYHQKPSLLVDIGTNGEVVLQSEMKLTACATAAGPAFEGCGLSCGSRARAGAIGTVRLVDEPFQIVNGIIGDVPPARASGICGSAYVDFLAEARRHGILNPSGRFNAAAWDHLPGEFRIEREGQRAVSLANQEGVSTASISEIDVALLLQAKAAIGAGIETLLADAGLRASELDRVHLAGGFGMRLNVRHAIEIGLLPGIRPEQVEVVGNTSLAGAVMSLLDRTTLEEMDKLREQVTVVELNLQKGFEDRYIDHLSLP